MDNKRLIEIYKEASKYFYSNQNNTNQKSKHWERYNLKEFTLDNLINFRNTGGGGYLEVWMIKTIILLLSYFLK